MLEHHIGGLSPSNLHQCFFFKSALVYYLVAGYIEIHLTSCGDGRKTGFQFPFTKFNPVLQEIFALITWEQSESFNYTAIPHAFLDLMKEIVCNFRYTTVFKNWVWKKSISNLKLKPIYLIFTSFAHSAVMLGGCVATFVTYFNL